MKALLPIFLLLLGSCGVENKPGRYVPIPNRGEAMFLDSQTGELYILSKDGELFRAPGPQEAEPFPTMD